MKKSNLMRVKVWLQSSCILFLIFVAFSSCKNFSSSFFEELQKSIEYVNADYVPVTIDVLYSYTESINPLPGIYETSYKKGDVINLQFVPKSEYQFQKWTAEPEDSVLFEDPLQPSTNVTILKADSQIVIKAVCAERPKVRSMLPEIKETGVSCSSVVRIVFSQEMSDKAIRFSQKELEELEITDVNAYQQYQRGDDSYYAYDKDGKKYFKNIQIIRRGTNISLTDYFKVPYFEDYDKSSLIIVPDENHIIPAGTEVEVIIDQAIFNVDNIPMKEPFSSFYITNADDPTPDNVAPSIVEIKNIWVEGATTTSGPIFKEITVTNQTDIIQVHFSGTILDYGYTDKSNVRNLYIGLDTEKYYDDILKGNGSTHINPPEINLPFQKCVDAEDIVFEVDTSGLTPGSGQDSRYSIFMWAKDGKNNEGKPIDTRYILIYNPE